MLEQLLLGSTNIQRNHQQRHHVRRACVTCLSESSRATARSTEEVIRTYCNKQGGGCYKQHTLPDQGDPGAQLQLAAAKHIVPLHFVLSPGYCITLYRMRNFYTQSLPFLAAYTRPTCAHHRAMTTASQMAKGSISHIMARRLMARRSCRGAAVGVGVKMIWTGRQAQCHTHTPRTNKEHPIATAHTKDCQHAYCSRPGPALTDC